MDPSVGNSFDPAEVLKCIQLGLLCVQEYPADRPTMSSVIAMLTGAAATITEPKQPAFSVRREVVSESSSDIKAFSVNEVTLSKLSGR